MLPHQLPPDNDLEEEYYRVYFGSDAEYYLHKLAQYRQGTRFTFNIGAFFFGIFWMLYRKLYKEALLAMVLIVVLSLLVENLTKALGLNQSTTTLVNNAFTILWSTFLGFVGNWLYLRQARAKVTKVLAQQPNEELAAASLQRTGGITLIPHIIVAAFILLGLLFFQFLRPN
ncbi:DUF2628 domain-containing protein [Rufibacter psychrotolerans]|uniref:DUF2628 domain-containing protein n=1 Tax=Rufibacter psychrotolerans TaxID=2812556 RepID=UPI001967EC36|nr:DUF2628 domain-containing protein [Rufibacter sp. SYSU D00308]